MARDPYTDPQGRPVAGRPGPAADPVDRALTERERELGVYDRERDYTANDARKDIRRGHESLDETDGRDARGNRVGDPYTPRDRRPRDVAYAEEQAAGAGRDHYGAVSSDPDQLQDEIEILQNRMAARLERVTGAFTPQNMIAQVTGEKNPDLFTTVDTVADAARRNPLAAALIGAGLASLVLGGRTRARYEPDPDVLAQRRAAYGVEGVTADGTRFAPSGIESDDAYDEDAEYDETGRYVGEPSSAEEAERRVKALQDVTAARLDRATDAIQDVYASGRARLTGAYEDVRRRFRSDDDRDDGYESPGALDWVKENPVTIGLGALAAGALAAGYYTASKPDRRPRRGPIPRDRALMVQDDYASVEDEYVRRDEETGAMPVSAAAPSPMGTGLTRTAPIGASGQMAGVATGGVSNASERVASQRSASRDTSGTSSSTPRDGDTAEEIVRRSDRQTSGAGFGSTAASRGEVASRPLSEQQNTTAREGSATPTPSTVHDAKASGGSSSGGSSGSTSSGTSASSSASGASATDRTLSRMAGDTQTPPGPRDGAPEAEGQSTATAPLTKVYPREG